jgi:two-component system NtrC family sensor kinase
MPAERLAAIGKVSAQVAHELNNPLDGILRFLNLAIRRLKEDPEKAEHYIGECRQGLLRMSNTLTQLLAFSRSRRNGQRPASISQVLRDCIALYEGRLQASNIDIEFEVPSGLPVSPMAELFEVVSNVVKNAVDAMGQDGRLSLSAAQMDGRVVIRVADTGPGIPEEIRDKVFEPFFSTNTTGTNTGLGLAMCRDTLKRVGGEIRLVPSEQGTTFEISVPVE